MAKKKAARKNGRSATRTRLIEAAKAAQKNAYCPYSRYPVGAAVLMDSGRIYTGCNVENASFGLAICAERVAIFKAVSHGEKKISALCVAAKSAKPCGACRQVIIEFAPKDADMIYVDWFPMAKKQKITFTKAGRLLPQAFNPSEAGL
ncbi:MAG: cytidine deaminase [Elusimicrobia bacterium CG08_land_8_20_14_0_20_59_10]|nr:MAG: cytidine deaminase [Elusimicrobia bacterium CG08_land_8_20_14_0_20_59_10]